MRSARSTRLDNAAVSEAVLQAMVRLLGDYRYFVRRAERGRQPRPGELHPAFDETGFMDSAHHLVKPFLQSLRASQLFEAFINEHISMTDEARRQSAFERACAGLPSDVVPPPPLHGGAAASLQQAFREKVAHAASSVRRLSARGELGVAGIGVADDSPRYTSRVVAKTPRPGGGGDWESGVPILSSEELAKDPAQGASSSGRSRPYSSSALSRGSTPGGSGYRQGTSSLSGLSTGGSVRSALDSPAAEHSSNGASTAPPPRLVDVDGDEESRVPSLSPAAAAQRSGPSPASQLEATLIDLTPSDDLFESPQTVGATSFFGTPLLLPPTPHSAPTAGCADPCASLESQFFSAPMSGNSAQGESGPSSDFEPFAWNQAAFSLPTWEAPAVRSPLVASPSPPTCSASPAAASAVSTAAAGQASATVDDRAAQAKLKMQLLDLRLGDDSLSVASLQSLLG